MNKMTQLQICRLYDEHRKPLLKIVNSKLKDIHASHDVVQDTFEQLIAHIEKNNLALDEEHLEGLIIRFYNQRLIDEIRKREVRASVPFDEERDGPIEHDFERTLVDRQDAKEVYSQLKETLKSEDLDMATLKYGYGFTLKEIGARYGMEANTVNQRIFKLKKKAKKLLGVMYRERQEK